VYLWGGACELPDHATYMLAERMGQYEDKLWCPAD
jgi:hypothetical protein